MKAIVTKYHGPTNTRGSRIIASDDDGNRVSIPYPHELSGGMDCHHKAAQALCTKMGWTGDLTGGSLKTGYVFVFKSADWGGCCRASNRLADMVCAMYHPKDEKARATWPTATWAEIIASELGVTVPDSEAL